MRVCSKCHKELDDSCFGSRKRGDKVELKTECKSCTNLYAHELYLQHKKEVAENGVPKILHKKLTPISKICTKCSTEKAIKDFPYDKSRDNYSNICKTCSYQHDKQKKSVKESKFKEKRALLAKGLQTCRVCGQVKPIMDMVKGSGVYIGICRVCNKQKYRVTHGTEERLHRREVRKDQKTERERSRQERQNLFLQGKRKCTKCGEVLPLARFGVKRHPHTMLEDYFASCRKCSEILYNKPAETRRRLKTGMENIIKFINTDFICTLCGKTKAPYEMGIVNGHLCWCKECQMRQKRRYTKKERERRRNTPYKRLILHMRKCLKDSLAGRKGHKTFVYLGCTGPELKAWLESQFTEGMSWGNRGIDGWHIDHYVPVSYFDMSKEEDRFLCWNYQNLRPLWGKENIDKGNSLPDDYLQHIERIKKGLKNNFSIE